MRKRYKGNQAKDPQQALPNFLIKRLSEGGFILVLSCALFLLLSLSTYEISDSTWAQISKNPTEISNAGGQVGAYLADGSYYLFGYFSFLIPFCLVYLAWLMVKDYRAFCCVHRPALLLRASGFIFTVIGSCSLLSLQTASTHSHLRQGAGGLLGRFVAEGFDYALSFQGATLLLVTILLVGVTLLTGLSWLWVVEQLGEKVIWAANFGLSLFLKSSRFLRAKLKYFRKLSPTLLKVKEKRLIVKEKIIPSLVLKPSLGVGEVLATIPSSVLPEKNLTPPRVVAKPLKQNLVAVGNLPSIDLLDKSRVNKAVGGYTHQELENFSREVEQHLLDFGIQADVVAVHPGPVITRFELQLAAGIKVSKLSALAKDLARSLSVISVRVVEVIPGKTVVGIELPNQHREMVCLSEVLSADVYQQAHSPITLALGVDIAGHPMVVDLAKMPHLLVAGTTGSGKSVGINAMILSLLFKSTPEQVRLIMVDPKMLELSVYDGIPHLLTPVVTDMKEAASALRWCVGEMERRYRLMASLGVRNLAGFNAKVSEAALKGEPLTDPLWKPTDGMDESAAILETLPYIVVIIDELADMMMVVGKKVEQLIARIAQKARAAGIHLILATQRPSVDVLTGLIKSNIPTRMSFQVSSKIDSRTILDQQGAEQLLGHGDMLYLAPGSGAPLRVHGAFVDDKEVHRVADDWRARGEPEYIEDITQILSEAGENGFNEEGQAIEEADPLYDQAVEFVLQTRKASISSLQRRLKVGYNRAARLIEEMERTGIVGPLEGGFRDVLVSTVTEG